MKKTSFYHLSFVGHMSSICSIALGKNAFQTDLAKVINKYPVHFKFCLRKQMADN